MAKNIGKIVQVIGPVVDIRYAAGQLPALNNAIAVSYTHLNVYKRQVTTIAIYIFLSNILGLFGFSSPTGNYSVTLMLTIITWVLVQIAQLKAGGFKAYMHSFIEPIPVFLPMNIFGKFSTLLSMSLRLFGNVLCGGIIMSLVYSFTSWCSTALINFCLLYTSGSQRRFEGATGKLHV